MLHKNSYSTYCKSNRYNPLLSPLQHLSTPTPGNKTTATIGRLTGDCTMQL